VPESAPVEIVEYTDPACPWAWGSEPTFRWLREGLGAQVAWRRVFGILFDEDDDQPADREAEIRHYERWLTGISEHTRAPYPERLHWIAATSWPASLVARAAEAQGADVAERVLHRLRETTFVDGRPADTIESALAAAALVAGVDLERLQVDASSATVLASVRADHDETRRPDAAVDAAAGDGPHPGARKELDAGHRYALPTLVVRGPAGTRYVPGWQPRTRYVEAVRAVAPGVRIPVPEQGDQPRPPI
jgi:predicted DsbA family dithiol-disulfide isomerase